MNTSIDFENTMILLFSSSLRESKSKGIFKILSFKYVISRLLLPYFILF